MGQCCLLTAEFRGDPASEKYSEKPYTTQTRDISQKIVSVFWPREEESVKYRKHHLLLFPSPDWKTCQCSSCPHHEHIPVALLPCARCCASHWIRRHECTASMLRPHGLDHTRTSVSYAGQHGSQLPAEHRVGQPISGKPPRNA